MATACICADGEDCCGDLCGVAVTHMELQHFSQKAGYVTRQHA
jgi:hypothetical protein